MSSLFNGSLDVTAIIEMANKAHTAYSRSPKNQKIYAAITIWLNDEPDAKTGNILSIQLNSSKDGGPADLALNNGKKVYVGNAKYAKKQSPEPLQAGSNGLAINNDLYGTPPPVDNSGQWNTSSDTGLPF